jgi:hypothetical protein
MNRKPENNQKRCREAIIAGVNASDLTRARTAVKAGVQSAQNQWIPTHLIVCALALELQDQISDGEPSRELMVYLRQLADFFSSEVRQSDRH